MTETTLFGRLLQQALPHCTQQEAANWPCEVFNSRHWQTIAAEGRWRVCVRTEPDADCSADYEQPPEPGTEWVGLHLELQDNWGKCYKRESLWGIETPGLRNVAPSAWQDCEGMIASTAAQLVRELLYSPVGLISNLNGEIAERESMIAELRELQTA